MWAVFSVCPHQYDNSVLEPSQANEPLLRIRLPVVFSGKHGFIEDRLALGQIDRMFAQVELSLGGVIARVLFIVYAVNSHRNGIAEQALAADRVAMDLTLLIAFSASFFLVALSPGLCMTLAMSLGISIGVRRTLWMMAGELTGIALVGTAAVLGVAALLLKAPTVFTAFKWVGAAYLFYTGWQTWRAEPLLPEQLTGNTRRTRSSLVLQGFITAAANPKAWAFLVALLPPFVDQSRPLARQLLALLALMLIIEFSCLQIYANGGRILSEQLHRRGKARWLNRIAGVQMVGVGIWLALG